MIKLLSLILLVVGVHAEALPLHVTATVQIFDQEQPLEAAKVLAAGWQITRDEQGLVTYTLDRTISFFDLPVRYDLGPTSFTINERGVVSLNDVPSYQIAIRNAQIEDFFRPITLHNVTSSFALQLELH